MERQRLHAASGHFPSFPTYHGTHGNSSTVDFVIFPQSYAESFRAATVLERSGRQLQHARVRRHLDYAPVMIRFEHAPDFFRPANRERPPLDMDLLCLAMTTDYRRAEFLAQVELETEAALRRHPPHAKMTDHKWQDVVAILQRSAAEFHVKRQLKEQMDGNKELIQVRENILSDRVRVRNRPAKIGTYCEDSLEERRAAEREQDRLAWKLKELTRLAQGARRRWNKHKKAALEMQLVEAEMAGRLEDRTDPLRDTKLLNSGKRSCLHWDTRVAWVLSRAHSATSGQSAPAQRRSKRKMNLTPMPSRRQNDLSAPLAKRFVTCDKRRAALPSRSCSLSGGGRSTRLSGPGTRGLRYRCSGNSSYAPWRKSLRQRRPFSSHIAARAPTSPS